MGFKETKYFPVHIDYNTMIKVKELNAYANCRQGFVFGGFLEQVVIHQSEKIKYILWEGGTSQKDELGGGGR